MQACAPRPTRERFCRAETLSISDTRPAAVGPRGRARAGGAAIPDAIPPPTTLIGAPASSWSPLRHTAFRSLWIAAVFSHIGSSMSDVGQGWLMSTIAPSPLMVALVVTAESLPYVLFGLVAGALADVVDRRRLLLVTQSLMALAIGALGAWTLLGTVTPWGLLALVAALGLATGLNDPAWYALPGELLPEGELAAGITLHGAGLNIGRTLGPAIGGAVVSTLGPGAAFVIDAVTFLLVIAALVAWRRPHTPSVLPAERVLAAVRSGVRYARHSAPLRRVIFHGFAFFTCGVVVLALMPVLARRTEEGALGLGALLGAMGVGAVAGTVLLPRLRARVRIDGVVTIGILLFAGALCGIAVGRSLALLVPLLVLAGAGWITVISSLNLAAQRASPTWVKARAISAFLIFAQAGVAAGGALWGTVATQAGLATAYFAAAGGLLLGLLVLWRRPLAIEEVGDLVPSHHWPDPVLAGEPHLDAGPVMVQLEYRVVPDRIPEFLRAMDEVGRSRRRGGAAQWWLLRDSGEAALFVETWVQESWGEHLRQHEHVSVADRALEARAVECLVEKRTPPARHFLPAARGPSAEAAASVVQATLLGEGGRP